MQKNILLYIKGYIMVKNSLAAKVTFNWQTFIFYHNIYFFIFLLKISPSPLKKILRFGRIRFKEVPEKSVISRAEVRVISGRPL